MRRRQQARRVLTLGAGPVVAFFGLGGASADPPDAMPRGGRAVLTSIELRLDSAQVHAAFGAQGALSARRLFATALTVEAQGTGTGELVLVAYRLRNGQPVATFESPPFTLKGGAPASSPAPTSLPGQPFYGGPAPVDRQGVATAYPVPAWLGAGDPARVVISAASGRPADWYQREVYYLVAVPADTGLRRDAVATPVVVFGHDVVTLGASTGGTAGTPGTAQDILRRHVETEQRCRGWVRDYTLYREVEGFIVPEHYEAYQGGPECRQVPIHEVQRRWAEETGTEEPEGAHGHMATGYDLLGQALDQELSREGVPGIGKMAIWGTSLMGDLFRVREAIDPDTLMVDDVPRRTAARGDFASRARLVGTETVDGRRAHHLRAEGLQDVTLDQPAGGPDFTLQAASLWLDVQRLVPMKLQFEMEANESGKVRPLILELLNQNYIDVPVPSEAGSIQVPARVVMRIKGLAEAMSAKDRAELQKAVDEVAKLKAQMASMPPAMQRMMQAQIDRLERMTGRQGESLAEATIDLVQAAVNEGPPYPGGTGSFQVGPRHFPNAMVIASWRDMSQVGYPVPANQAKAPPGIWLWPEHLEFRGRDASGWAGWLKLTFNLQGALTVLQSSGGYREPDGTEWTFADDQEGGEYAIVDLTPTMAFGWFMAPESQGNFTVGHQPCSGAPRAISPGERAVEAALWSQTGQAVSPQSQAAQQKLVAACLEEVRKRGGVY